MMSCTACGACCAAFRVSFHRAELDEEPGGFVPSGLADPETASIMRLRGTDYSPPRCVALVGQLGRDARCGIYEWRPGPCREFEAGSEACARARARHGLPPWAS